MDTKEKVLKALADAKTPMKAGELSASTGIDKKDVDKSIKALVAENKLYSPKKCFYDIKK